MTPKEYRRILDDHGLTQSWVGEALTKTSTSGRRWAAGTSPIPKCVAIVLRLLDAGFITKASIEEAGKEPESKRRA
jgi:ParB-like chromosome segregation protein Spo0J